jgi:predicted nucleic acid-binding protein
MTTARTGIDALERATAMSPVLADSSVWGWRHRFDVSLRDAWVAALRRRAVATCDQVRLELLYSARNAAEFQQLRADLGRLADARIDKAQWTRALDVYELLAATGGAHQRRVKHPDLLIAAAAETAGWPLVHYDGDFDVIASLTSQACVAVTPLGSL